MPARGPFGNTEYRIPFASPSTLFFAAGDFEKAPGRTGKLAVAVDDSFWISGVRGRFRVRLAATREHRRPVPRACSCDDPCLAHAECEFDPVVDGNRGSGKPSTTSPNRYLRSTRRSGVSHPDVAKGGPGCHKQSRAVLLARQSLRSLRLPPDDAKSAS